MTKDIGSRKQENEKKEHENGNRKTRETKTTKTRNKTDVAQTKHTNMEHRIQEMYL